MYTFTFHHTIIILTKFIVFIFLEKNIPELCLFNVPHERKELHRHTCTRAVRVLFTGTPVPFEFTPLLGGLIGVVAALLLVTVTILAALKVRSERRAQRPGDLPLKKATAPSSEDLYDADDRNPDVVPTNKGMLFPRLSLYNNIKS